VLSIFSLLLIGQQGLVHFFKNWPLLSIGWGILQAVCKQQGKLTNKTLLTLSEAPAARQTTFIIGKLQANLQ
jgi:hypothetical protein